MAHTDHISCLCTPADTDTVQRGSHMLYPESLQHCSHMLEEEEKEEEKGEEEKELWNTNI